LGPVSARYQITVRFQSPRNVWQSGCGISQFVFTFTRVTKNGDEKFVYCVISCVRNGTGDRTSAQHTTLYRCVGVAIATPVAAAD